MPGKQKHQCPLKNRARESADQVGRDELARAKHGLDGAPEEPKGEKIAREMPQINMHELKGEQLPKMPTTQTFRAERQPEFRWSMQINVIDALESVDDGQD